MSMLARPGYNVMTMSDRPSVTLGLLLSFSTLPIDFGVSFVINLIQGQNRVSSATFIENGQFRFDNEFQLK